MSQKERFVMLSCMAASFIQRMYELGEEYIRNLDDLNCFGTVALNRETLTKKYGHTRATRNIFMIKEKMPSA